MLRGVCLSVALAAACAALPAAALAQRADVSQELFDPHGDPLLVANSVPNGRKGVMRWLVCRPQAACVPVASRRPYELVAGPSVPGTRFEVTLDYGGRRTSDTSDPWLGRVTAVSPPVLAGTPAVGATVRVAAAPWTGGWGGEGDELRIEACRTPAAARCETLSAPLALGRPPGDAEARISPWYAGWYVQALDARLAADTAFARPGYFSALDVPPLVRDATVAVSAPELVSGPPLELPRVTLRRRVARAGHRLVFGTVRCARCRVTLRVLGFVWLSRRVPVRGRAALTIPRAHGLRPGRVDVQVLFEAHRIAERHERLQRVRQRSPGG